MKASCKSRFYVHHPYERPADSFFLKYSNISKCRLFKQFWQRLVHQIFRLQYFFARHNFSCTAWPSLLKELGVGSNAGGSPCKSCSRGFCRENSTELPLQDCIYHCKKDSTKTFQRNIQTMATVSWCPVPGCYIWVQAVGISLCPCFNHNMLLLGANIIPGEISRRRYYLQQVKKIVFPWLKTGGFPSLTLDHCNSDVFVCR